MDFETAEKLKELYKRMHSEILHLDCNITDWPVCIDPRERHRSFLSYLDNLPEEDKEIKEYYKKVSEAIELLVWTKKL